MAVEKQQSIHTPANSIGSHAQTVDNGDGRAIHEVASARPCWHFRDERISPALHTPTASTAFLDSSIL
jgi:hypothetical protein